MELTTYNEADYDFDGTRITTVRVNSQNCCIALDFDVGTATSGAMIEMTHSEARRLIDLLSRQLSGFGFDNLEPVFRTGD